MGRWNGKGGIKVGESVNIKKISECKKKKYIYIYIYYSKIEKKKDNDVDADMV